MKKSEKIWETFRNQRKIEKFLEIFKTRENQKKHSLKTLKKFYVRC